MNRDSVIEAVDVFPLWHPLCGPPGYLLVRVTTDQGVAGYGEASDSFGCAFAPFIGAAVTEVLGPLIIGERLSSVETLTRRMRAATRLKLGDAGVIIQALSGVEIALWDVFGKERDASVSEILGATRRLVPVYASAGFLSVDALNGREGLDVCLSRGVRGVKVRLGPIYGPGFTVADDLRLLEEFIELKRASYPHLEVYVDGAESFSLPSAMKVASQLERLGVGFFEEPMPQNSRQSIRRLVDKTTVPVAYGEHLYTAVQFSEALQQGWCDIIQPDPSVSGGISEMKLVGNAAEAYGVAVIPHSFAGPIAFAAALHLAAALPNCPMIEYSFTQEPLWRELTGSADLLPEAVVDGAIPVPDGPGLGVEIDDVAISRLPFVAREDAYPIRHIGTM